MCVIVPSAAATYFKSSMPRSYTTDLWQRTQTRGRTEGHAAVYSPHTVENRLWTMQQFLSTDAPTKAPCLLRAPGSPTSSTQVCKASLESGAPQRRAL